MRLICALAMLLLLTACGEKTKPGQGATTQVPTAAEAPAYNAGDAGSQADVDQAPATQAEVDQAPTTQPAQPSTADPAQPAPSAP